MPRLIHVLPPSVVVRTELVDEPLPTATQLVAEEHDTPAKSLIPLGTGEPVQVAPLSAVVTKVPPCDPAPTATQWAVEGHDTP